MIKLINVNKYYQSGQGKYHALRDINLVLPDKGMCFIVGKSGSGKSTLLNVIGGVDSYDSGELYIDNLNTKDFNKYDYNSYRNTYIGFIFQEFNVIKSLTVYDNVALSLQLLQKDIKNEHEKIMTIIETVGLSGKEHRRMNEISGGERQRVAVARALVKDPKVIIADEPTGNLDSKNRDIVMDLLKTLSKDRLVIIVTHDKHLSSKYADREIKIKDGAITSDKIFNEDSIVEESEKDLIIQPIQPKLKVSLDLSWKSFILHKVRFIFIIALFTISLTFAGIVINLFFANPSKEYADYQLKYGSLTLDLSQNYTSSGITNNSAFFLFELSELKNDFASVNNGENDLECYTYMKFNFPIDGTSKYEGDFYTNKVNNIISYTEDNFSFSEETILNYTNVCYITDYLAQALIEHQYLGNLSQPRQLLGKTLSFPGFYASLYIEKIIDTNYEEFINADMSDSKVYGAFQDNLEYYSSIFMKKDKYDNIIKSSNIPYFYDNVIYSSNGIKGFAENVKYMPYSTSFPISSGKLPEKPKPGEQLQIAVSKGFINNYFKKGLPLGSTLSITGVTRIPTSTSALVVGVVDTEECIIYTPATYESELFNNLLSSSFKEGGFLLLKTSNNPTISAEAFDIVMNNISSNLSINNVSFAKLKLVKDFINNNLFFFAGLFFVFCLFSILMIFNFIIINIKNSTRDIGIYMSLGMSGFKISMIYMFQVLIISLISSIVSLIFTGAFLIVLDIIFNAQTLIHFSIIKMTFLGIIGIIGIAFITPTIAIMAPLFNLSKKKPIDVIKES